MVVIIETDSIVGENFASLVKYGDGVFNVVFVKIAVVGNLGATGVFNAERFGFFNKLLGVVLQEIVVPVSADENKMMLLALGDIFLNRQSIRSRVFDITKSEVFGRLEAFLDVFGEDVSETIHLETDGAFENVVGSDFKTRVVLGERGGRA